VRAFGAPIEERHDTADVEPLLAERAHGVPRGRAGREDVLQEDHPLAEPPPRLLDHVPGAVVLRGLPHEDDVVKRLAADGGVRGDDARQMATAEHDAGNGVHVPEFPDLLVEQGRERLVDLPVEHRPFRVDVELGLAARRELEPLAGGRDLH
jgi:hypothetical protein